jgi:hypothetical protein
MHVDISLEMAAVCLPDGGGWDKRALCFVYNGINEMTTTALMLKTKQN